MMELASQKHSKTQKIIFLLLFLLLLSLATAFIIIWRDVQQTNHALINTQKKLITLETQQTLARNAFTQEITQLTSRVSTNQQTYKLSEVIYLVRMANLRLTIQHDIPTTLLLLKQANQELNRLNSPDLEPFREAVLKNINILQLITPIDLDNMTNILAQLQNDVPNLSLLVAPKPNTSILDNTTHQIQKKWWNRAWDNIKASLKELVVIRHQSENIPAMMTPSQQIYLEENLQLLLMQAQWGLLNHNAHVYQNSLHQASEWVQKYYVQGSAPTQLFLKSLTQLRTVKITPDFPNLLESLSLLPSQGVTP